MHSSIITLILFFSFCCPVLAQEQQHHSLKEEKKDSTLKLDEINESLEKYKKAITNQQLIEIEKETVNKEVAVEKKETTQVDLIENENSSITKQMSLFALIVIVAFALILLYRNQKHLRKNKTLQERFSQELLVSQEKERIRISKDLHDGLGQQLLLIKNKLVNSKDEDIKMMVENAIDEVRTISRDLHPFQLQELGVTKAIEYALVNIDENTNLFISSEIDNIDKLFSPEQEVNIFRMVQESLNNVIKHANAEAIKVTVSRLNKLIVITIKDNGEGFDFSEKYETLKSLGLKTLLERSKFLNGQMKVQSIKNNGTLLEFQIPIK